MHRYLQTRRFAVVFTVMIALILGVFAHISSASSAQLTIYSPRGSATCANSGVQRAAAFQGDSIGIQLYGYRDREPVEVNVTFPDGRIFSLAAAQRLDGVVDQPVNTPSVGNVQLGGELYFDYRVTGKWPYGCYTFTGRGLESGKTAQDRLVIMPGGGPGPNPGLAKLAVLENGSGQPSGMQGALVDIFGEGFRAGETVSVWITAPDGTVISFPQQATSNAGNFASSFQFTGANPIGLYQFTALGASSNYRVFASFTLNSRPVTVQGWAELRVAYPADGSDPQRRGFEIQGERFSPGERVDIWATLPDGAVRGLPSQFADPGGSFYAVLYLDEELPTGFYQVTAQGNDSRRLVITALTLQQTQGVQPYQFTTPNVIDSNTDITGGPINIEGAEDSPGPEVSPSDFKQ